MMIMQTPQSWIKHIAIIGVVAMLAACGGGGGDGGAKNPPAVRADVTPDSFTFVSKDEAIPGESYTSNAITVRGIDVAVPVSITGGEYAVDNGDFTAATALVKPGQTIVVRAIAAPTPVSIVNAVLTIGGVTGTYSITTLADETAPTAEFMFPPPVSMTDGATVLVRGVASDDYSEITAVTVNGNAVETTDNFASWQVRIPLKPGEDNPLVVETTDAVGNTSRGAAEVMVHQGAITDAFPDETNEFDGVIDFVIDRLDGRNRLLTIGGNTPEVISVDLSTGERTSFINLSPLEPTDEVWGIALDEQAKEVFFKYGGTILAQPLDGGVSRKKFDERISNGIVFTTDNLDEDLRIVVVGGSEGKEIVVTNLAFSEFTKLSSTTEAAESLIGWSFGMALDGVNSRYLVTDAINQRIIAVDRTTGAQSIFSSDDDDVGIGASFGAALGGIAVDKENLRVIVAEIGSGKLFSIDLATGNRTLLSSPDIPNTDVILKSIYGVKINTPLSYAFVADYKLGVIAVDLVTGHRVVFSKSATTL